jgi:hypothetical protein
MLILIDRSSHLPIFVQIEQCVRSLITRDAPSRAKPPSTRELGPTLGVNRLQLIMPTDDSKLTDWFPAASGKGLR